MWREIAPHNKGAWFSFSWRPLVSAASFADAVAAWTYIFSHASSAYNSNKNELGMA